MRKITLLLLVLLTSAALAQTAGSERRLSDFRFGPRPDDQLLYVAPHGDGYLAYYRRGTQVRSVRIDAAGRTDLASARTVFESSALYPFLRGSGDVVVLFWINQSTLYFSPVSSEGTPTRPEGMKIADHVSLDSVQCNRSRCLVNYYDNTSTSAAPLGTIVTTDGQIVRSAVPLPRIFYRPSGGTDDNGFLLTGLAGDELHAVRIDNDGGMSFDTIIQKGDTSTVTTADFDGERYALVWSNSGYPSAENATFIGSLSLDGQLTGTRKLFDGGGPVYGLLVWNGARHLFAYNLVHYRTGIPEAVEPAEIRLLSLDATLAPIGSAANVTTADQGNYVTSVAVNGTSSYLGWNEAKDGYSPVVMHGVIVDAAANVSARNILSVGALPQTAAALASTGDQHLALFTERDLSGDAFQLRFVRVSRGGAILDTPPRLLSDTAYGRVAAAALGSDFLVVWYQREEEGETYHLSVRGSIIHADGSVDPLTLPAIGGFLSLSIATDGESWIVADGVRAIRISASGQVLTPNPVQFGGVSTDVAIATDGERYLAAWTGFELQGCPECNGLHLAVLGGDLSIAVPNRRISNETLYGVSAAFNGREYLVESMSSRTVTLTRVSRNGEVVGTPVLLDLREYGGKPIVIRFGQGWLATWSTDGGRVAVRVADDGSVVERPFLFAFTHLVSTGDNSAAGLTPRQIDAPPFGPASAVFLREITWLDGPRKKATR